MQCAAAVAACAVVYTEYWQDVEEIIRGSPLTHWVINTIQNSEAYLNSFSLEVSSHLSSAILSCLVLLFLSMYAIYNIHIYIYTYRTLYTGYGKRKWNAPVRQRLRTGSNSRNTDASCMVNSAVFSNRQIGWASYRWGTRGAIICNVYLRRERECTRHWWLPLGVGGRWGPMYMYPILTYLIVWFIPSFLLSDSFTIAPIVWFMYPCTLLHPFYMFRPLSRIALPLTEAAYRLSLTALLLIVNESDTQLPLFFTHLGFTRLGFTHFSYVLYKLRRSGSTNRSIER